MLLKPEELLDHTFLNTSNFICFPFSLERYYFNHYTAFQQSISNTNRNITLIDRCRIIQKATIQGHATECDLGGPGWYWESQ